jgi:thymidine phosphorylase
MTQAQQLKKLFEFVGSRLGIHVQVMITDGRQPIGRGVGPLLEARDVMQVLQCAPEAPSDLRQKALRLAGRIIEFDPDVRGGDGFQIARDILDSGRALAKMNAIVAAQGPQPRAPRPGRLSFEVHAPAAGYVTSIDNFQIARIARLAGAPITKGSGVDLLRRVGDRVRKGEPLYRVFAEYPAERDFARARTERGTGFTIGRERDVPQAFVEF